MADPKWDDTTEVTSTPSWDDTSPVKSETQPSAWDNSVMNPTNISDAWSSFKENIPLAGAATKAGSYVGSNIMAALPDSIKGAQYQGKSAEELRAIVEGQQKAETAAREERSPIASTVGGLAGAVSAPMPGTALGRIGLNVADVATRQDNVDEAEDAALTTGLISAAFESIPYVGKFLKGRAVKSAEEIAGLATSRGEKAIARGTVPGGEQLLEEGLIPTTLSRKTAAKQIASVANKERAATGEKIGEALAQTEEKMGQEALAVWQKPGNLDFAKLQQTELQLRASASDLAEKLNARADELAMNPGKSIVANKIRKEAAEFEKLAALKQKKGLPEIPGGTGITSQELNDMKSAYDKRIYNAAKALKGSEGLQEVRTIIKNQIDQNMAAAGKHAPEQLDTLNKQYQRQKTLADAAIAQSTRKEKSIFSISNVVTGGLGFLVNPVIGATATIGKHLLSTPAGVKAEYATGKALQSKSAKAIQTIAARKASKALAEEDK